MADKLTSRQIAQLAVLEALPNRFALIHRLIEEIAGMRADESVNRRLVRLLDESKAATSSIGLAALTDTMGNMAMLARRTGGLQMKIRGLREMMGSLKINYDGALRAAKQAEPDAPEAPGTP